MKRIRSSEQKAQLVRINAGGILFTTLLSTLTNAVPHSLIAHQFSDLENVPLDSDGHYFVDMSPANFALLLEILRNPSLIECPPKDMPVEHFAAFVKAQRLKLPEPDPWPEKREAIEAAWKRQDEADRALDKHVLELILGWIDLPALIDSPEVQKSIYIPYGYFKLEVEEADLALYISDSVVQLQTLLDQVSDKTARLFVEEVSHLAETPTSILFEGKTYFKANTKLYAVTIHIGK